MEKAFRNAVLGLLDLISGDTQSTESSAENLHDIIHEFKDRTYGDNIDWIQTFEEAGVLTGDTGFVVGTEHGHKFHLTVTYMGKD